MSPKQRYLPMALRSLVYLGLCFWFLWSVFPAFWGFMTSIKQVVDGFAIPPKWVFYPTFEWYYKLWWKEPFLRYLGNSTIISLGTVFISMPLASLAAYALTRYKGTVSFMLLLMALLFRMFPRTLLIIPFYQLARALGIYDTRFVVIVVMVALNQPFSIWLLRGFFMQIPESIEESAMIDGCSRFGAFWRITLPLMKPGLVAASLFSILLSYNDFLIPLVLTSTRSQPLTVAIAEYGAEDISYWSISAAGAMSIALPIVVFILFAQRHLVRGLTFGAVKG